MTSFSDFDSKGLLQSRELHEYVLETTVYPRESEFLKEIRAITANHPRSVMATSPDAGQLIALLLKLANAKKTIELGVFTGYSLLLTALTIPEDGKITAIDIDRDTYEMGLPIIQKAGVEHKINFIESPALSTLDILLENHENRGSFDFAFVDADKEMAPSNSKGLLQSRELFEYVLETSVYPREPELLKEIRVVTANHPRSLMATSQDAGQLIALLLKLANAKKTIEIGVFTGYSLLLTALTIPEDGKASPSHF